MDAEESRNDDDDDDTLAVAIAHTASNLAFVMAKRGDNARAIELYEEAVAAYKRHLHEDDAALATAQENARHLVSITTTGDGVGGHLIWGGRGCQMANPICFSFM